MPLRADSDARARERDQTCNLSPSESEPVRARSSAHPVSKIPHSTATATATVGAFIAKTSKATNYSELSNMADFEDEE